MLCLAAVSIHCFLCSEVTSLNSLHVHWQGFIICRISRNAEVLYQKTSGNSLEYPLLLCFIAWAMFSWSIFKLVAKTCSSGMGDINSNPYSISSL